MSEAGSGIGEDVRNACLLAMLTALPSLAWENIGMGGLAWALEGGPLERAPAAVGCLRGVLPGAVLLLLAPRVPGGPRSCCRWPALLGAGLAGSAWLSRLWLRVWGVLGGGGGGPGGAVGCLGLAALSLPPWPAPCPRLPALAPLVLLVAGRLGE